MFICPDVQNRDLRHNSPFTALFKNPTLGYGNTELILTLQTLS